MPKTALKKTDLDRKVEAFLARGVSMGVVRGYTLSRDASDFTMLTVKIFADGLEDIALEEE